MFKFSINDKGILKNKIQKRFLKIVGLGFFQPNILSKNTDTGLSMTVFFVRRKTELLSLSSSSVN